MQTIQSWYTAPLTGSLASLVMCALIIGTQHWHGRHSLDHETDGHQKFHAVPVPRIGGVAFVVAILAILAVWVAIEHDKEHIQIGAALLGCAIPAFFAGLTEDLTKRVSVKLRLLSSFTSAALAGWFLRATLTSVDTAVIDSVLAISPIIAFIFTCFAVAGVANAVNIIDGFNGLAAGSAFIMLCGLYGLAWLHSDPLVMDLCMLAGAPLLGFMALNYPKGKIFMGDGGAYLIGFWLAECAILLLIRNPTISAWAVLLVCIYPVFETIFSMWRKDVHRKTGMGRPDRLHLHMLVYRRLIARKTSNTNTSARHALTSALLWASIVPGVAAALIFTALNAGDLPFVAGVVLYAICYTIFYKKLIRGCHPKPPLLDNSKKIRA